MADFGGRYRLDRRLGAGGMGEVWLAYDEELADRPVAVKVMRSKIMADEADLARFQREMRLASRMQHPNIMTVFTTGSDQGVPFMVMEYLQGSDLAKMPTGWSADDIARIGGETCTALAYAHALDPGVVHRDIKPGNLFICDTGTVKITDFGLAKAVTETGLSTAGTVFGTMPYISPEQWLGAPLTFSDDIWAVGCVLYQLLSGRLPRPYKTPTEYFAAATRREHVAPLPDAVPAGLADAVLAMLHTDPLVRPTASQAIALLSERRTHPVPVLVTSPRPLATAARPPADHEMALAGTRWPEAGPSMWQSRPTADRPLNPAGPVTPVRERQEPPLGEGPARAFLRKERNAKRKQKRKLLIAAIAALAVIGAGIYAATSAFTGPTLSQGTTSPFDATSAKRIALTMMPGFGFNQTTQYSCLLILWDQISDWNVYAESKSGSYGIPQATPGDVMASAGADWQTDAATQIKWGLGYIKDTYGTPCGAWQYEESNGSY